MIAPEEYKQEIQNIQKKSQLPPISSNFEILQHVSKMGDLQLDLRKMARRIKEDAAAAIHTHEETSKNAGGGSLLSAIFGGRQQNDAQKQAQQRHKQLMAAYKDALNTAGELCDQLDVRKAELLAYLDSALARSETMPASMAVAEPAAPVYETERRRVEY